MFFHKKENLKKANMDERKKVTVTQTECLGVHNFCLDFNVPANGMLESRLDFFTRDFILTVSERMPHNCYWLISAYDFFQFYDYYNDGYDELETYILNYDSFVSAVFLDAYHILLLVNQMNAYVMESIENIKLPDNKLLEIAVRDAIFAAFRIDNIETPLTDMSKCSAACEVEKCFTKFHKEIEISISVSHERKGDTLYIACPSDKCNYIKDCIFEILNKHNIEFVFIEEHPKPSK
jgi:hypothetical protein